MDVGVQVRDQGSRGQDDCHGHEGKQKETRLGGGVKKLVGNCSWEGKRNQG